MKTNPSAARVYRFRVWAGLGLMLLVALAEIWMALSFGADSVPGNTDPPGRVPFEICDIVR